jgi:ATP-dependent Zn protease
MGGGHDDVNKHSTNFLVEMDGFGANEGVIIIAATTGRTSLTLRCCVPVDLIARWRSAIRT